MRRSVRLCPAVALSCLALSAGACGSSSDSAPELSPESAAAVELVNAACARWNATLEARGDFPVLDFDPEDPSVRELTLVGEYFAAGHPARDRMITAIAALDVPGEIEERFDAFVAALTTAQENAERQVSAAREGNVDAFVATLDEADASRQAIEETAEALGATECRA